MVERRPRPRILIVGFAARDLPFQMREARREKVDPDAVCAPHPIPGLVFAVDTPPSIEAITWGSYVKRTLYDYDVILMDLAGLIGNPQLQMTAMLQRKQVDEFLATEDGGLLICFCSDPGISIDLSPFLPSAVKINMMHEFSEEFRVKHKGSLSWPFNLYTGQDFYFVQPLPSGSDIIAVNKADKVLSFYYNCGKGRVVLWPQMKQNKVQLVKYAIDHLIPKLVGVPKPPWVDGVMFHDEKTLRTQINDNQLKIDCYQKWKILLYSTGWQLAEVVKEALNLLGVKTDDPATKPGDPKKRYDHDLEIRLPTDLTGIVEVTGSTGAIDVEKVRQLMDYVVTVEKEEPEKKIKGILIGNSHREKLPDQRDAAFTEKAVERAFQNEFCLYTTAELYKTLESAQKGQGVTDRLSKILSEGKGCATK